MEAAIAVPALLKMIEFASPILRDEYSRWRQGKIEDKERFKEANKKVRVATSRSIVHMQNSMMSLGSKRIFLARTLAENVSKIAYDLDEAAEETKDIMKREVYEATKNLARAFNKWQTELNPYKLTTGKTGIREDMKFRSYSPGEMMTLLDTFYRSLEDLE